MPSAQQLTTDSYTGLGIAARSINGQHKFHRGGFGLSVIVRRRGISHDAWLSGRPAGWAGAERLRRTGADAPSPLARVGNALEKPCRTALFEPADAVANQSTEAKTALCAKAQTA
ncbi:MAG: hypothetical protein VX424_17470 [Actinomycetota bacterium]|nr:hypothetical protein [Actinomycetota bacterium]